MCCEPYSETEFLLFEFRKLLIFSIVKEEDLSISLMCQETQDLIPRVDSWAWGADKGCSQNLGLKIIEKIETSGFRSTQSLIDDLRYVIERDWVLINLYQWFQLPLINKVTIEGLKVVKRTIFLAF
jgi:hypothetical protein